MAQMKTRYKGLRCLILFASGLWISCAKDIDYEKIAQNVAGPTAIAHLNSSHFYVLNSDFDQRYDSGSILVLDHEGKKIGSVETPRLGTQLKVVGSDMLATFSSDVGKDAKLMLFSLADPDKPKLEKTFVLESQPISIAVAESYQYFAVSCSNGDFYIGELKTPRSNSSIKLVRHYEYPRRAMYLDKTREMVFAFPTMDYGVSITRDERLSDVKTYLTDETLDQPNDIPDSMETSAEQRAYLAQRYRYQFIAYDIADQRSEGFPLKENKDVLAEQRFVFFKLKDSSQKEDYPEDKDATKKFYRTNFWAAIPDPTMSEGSAFLLSHRDPYARDIKKGNDVIRVKFKVGGDPKAASADTPPLLDSYFEFERVYGFSSEQPEKPFPAAIAAQQVGGEDVLLVNHFNNLNVTREGAKFSLAQKQINGNHKRYELDGKPPHLSYYEMSIMPDGRTLAGSFFGHMVLLFDVDPSTNITEAKVTEIK